MDVTLVSKINTALSSTSITTDVTGEIQLETGTRNGTAGDNVTITVDLINQLRWIRFRFAIREGGRIGAVR